MQLLYARLRIKLGKAYRVDPHESFLILLADISFSSTRTLSAFTLTHNCDSKRSGMLLHFSTNVINVESTNARVKQYGDVQLSPEIGFDEITLCPYKCAHIHILEGSDLFSFKNILTTAFTFIRCPILLGVFSLYLLFFIKVPLDFNGNFNETNFHQGDHQHLLFSTHQLLVHLVHPRRSQLQNVLNESLLLRRNHLPYLE